MAKKSTSRRPAQKSAPAPAKMSLMKAAIAVLERSEEAMNTKQIVDAAKSAGLWSPGSGKTPEQTLYSAIVREIKAKGEASRFKLVARGHFKLAAAE